ncbi:MBL fold metallo-hydrolase [Microbacterium sp. zg-Y818]|uniref:MBL fold metallo-hydrolase n=1 Tax=unclassified Microbacterium TaxID=2609290 RepID=UPI00214AA186|nr:MULTISPECIES: MBL fold metallo-hydrolase [unclassified Microbacterium]MCR2800162.1 MBL fold metallo-hydrolase [Microbacterium sp. zg.Y818]WIM22131.1 MBL fold metallo-hydrolase [Microbacterium sp. zg-Y818]
MDAAAERWTGLVTRVLAPNAGPMTLDGTNSLVIGARDATSVVVVDPGPDDDGHLQALQQFGPVELILLTHHHHDHTESAPRFAALTGAPVRAFDPGLCIDGPPLTDGERIDAAGTVIEVVGTPGHTADSVSLHLPHDAPAGDPEASATGSMLTGDTILGRGTTIIAAPDGSLGSYLATLERLRAYGRIPTLPAHGPMLPDLVAVCDAYTEHRRGRLQEVRDALTALGQSAATDADLVAAVTDAVYGGVDPAVRFAAEASVRAQLAYLGDGSAAG